MATGASLYASTVDVSDEVREKTRDKTKIQLEIGNEATTVETELFVPFKILKDKTEGEIPAKIFVEVTRHDGAWSSGKVDITTGDIIEVFLLEDVTNSFEVILYDDRGNLLECEPNNFTIIQGIGTGSAPLPYNIGIEILDSSSNKIVFRTIKGLEKNKSLTATGVMNGLKTQKQIRPGIGSDYLEISIFQGEDGADGTRAIYNHHINTIYVTGNDLPGLLPANSDVDITLNVDKSQKITGTAHFPYLDFDYEFECQTQIDSIQTDWLANELNKAESSIIQLKRKGVKSNELQAAEHEIIEYKKLFGSAKDDTDTKQQILSNLRKTLKVIDSLVGDREWPELEKELKDAFYELEELNKKKGNEQTTQLVNNLRPDVDQAIREKDIKNAPQLIEMIETLKFELERLEHLIGFILGVENDFDRVPWKDRTAALNSINSAKKIIYENPSIASLQPIVNSLWDNGRFDERIGESNAGNGPSEVLRG